MGIKFEFGRPTKNIVHFADAETLLKKTTACGLKKWDAATGERDWVSCKDCLHVMKVSVVKVYVRKSTPQEIATSIAKSKLRNAK